MNEHLDPHRPHPADVEPVTTPVPASEINRTEGSGAIIVVVAAAALIIAGMLYIMQPPSDAPASMSSEAPARTAPATPPTAPEAK